MHRNPEEWQKVGEYIPERFDPSSPYYLRADGKKRHPQSFSPFLGGKRICIGRTFAEKISKCLSLAIIGRLDYEFVNPEHYISKPTIEFMIPEPLVNVRIKSREN